MISVKKSALVNYSAEQMYLIVSDIASYPEFLQWCSGTQVLEVEQLQDKEMVTASVDIRYKGISQSFTTRNTNVKPSSIILNLFDTSGPFDSMQGEWKFTDLSEDMQACKIEFELNFSTNSKVLNKLFETVFNQITNLQVEGFIKRADQLYK